MTFTPDPPSMIVLAISFPFTITVIAGLFVSSTVGPSSGLVKNAGAGVGFGFDDGFLQIRGESWYQLEQTC